MQRFKLMMTYAVAILGAILMAVFGVKPLIAFSLILAVGLYLIYKQIYTVYFSKNLQRIEKFITDQQNNPVYNHLYMSAHGTKEEELAAIERILASNKQPLVQHTYLFNRALLLDDIEMAKKEARQIPKESLRIYCIAYVKALEGDAEGARAASFEKDWMTYAIEAIIAWQLKDVNIFEAQVTKSLETVRGIQYYQSFHAFRKLKDELMDTQSQEEL